jgi:hypothetical protein
MGKRDGRSMARNPAFQSDRQIEQTRCASYIGAVRRVLRELHGLLELPVNEIASHELRSLAKKKSEACHRLMK